MGDLPATEGAVMTERLPVEQRDEEAGSSNEAPHGPGRWLLTWAGVFSMVIVTAIIFIVAGFLASR